MSFWCVWWLNQLVHLPHAPCELRRPGFELVSMHLVLFVCCWFSVSLYSLLSNKAIKMAQKTFKGLSFLLSVFPHNAFSHKDELALHIVNKSIVIQGDKG